MGDVAAVYPYTPLAVLTTLDRVSSTDEALGSDPEERITEVVT